MRPTRGRPLRFMAMLLALWIGARVAILWWEQPIAPQRPTTSGEAVEERIAGLVADGANARTALVKDVFAEAWTPDRVREDGRSILVRQPESPSHEGAHDKSSEKAVVSADFPRPPASVDAFALLPLTVGATRGPQTPGALASPLPAPRLPKLRGPSPFSLYAYAFYRPGGGDAALAETRYGGSQTGAIAGYRIAGSPRRPVEAIARLSYAPDDTQSLEPGIGLRWTPVRGLSLAAEYRRRAEGTGTAIAYVAGGPQPQKLPAGFTLESYGQAGVYEQSGIHPFYDVQAAALRPVADIARASIAAGAGAWSGGTTDVQRLDIGPRIAASVSIGSARVTLAADYRVRIAGSAAPGDGPAFTLSTGF